ncbi:MAG TPA: hypothetical protein VLS25_09990 [Dehalococcoidia bacterium]|nr:hypothetical protein [Dehalococcoidia bacterium]
MTAQFMVLLTDEKDAARGEVRWLDSAAAVAHYVETLLEGGFSSECIRVFHATEIALEVSYRPVVSLAASNDEPHDAPAAQAQPEGENPHPSADEQADGEFEEEAQGVRNGVRFSELFRPS